MVLVQTADDISWRVSRLIFERNYRRKDVAAALGISPQLLSSKLHNHSNYTLKDIAGLAELFDVSTDYLLGREAVK